MTTLKRQHFNWCLVLQFVAVSCLWLSVPSLAKADSGSGQPNFKIGLGQQFMNFRSETDGEIDEFGWQVTTVELGLVGAPHNFIGYELGFEIPITDFDHLSLENLNYYGFHGRLRGGMNLRGSGPRAFGAAGFFLEFWCDDDGSDNESSRTCDFSDTVSGIELLGGVGIGMRQTALELQGRIKQPGRHAEFYRQNFEADAARSAVFSVSATFLF